MCQQRQRKNDQVYQVSGKADQSSVNQRATLMIDWLMIDDWLCCRVSARPPETRTTLCRCSRFLLAKLKHKRLFCFGEIIRLKFLVLWRRDEQQFDRRRFIEIWTQFSSTVACWDLYFYCLRWFIFANVRHQIVTLTLEEFSEQTFQFYHPVKIFSFTVYFYSIFQRLKNKIS